MAAAKMPASQMAQEQTNEENLQRAAGMQSQDIDRYWGRSLPPSPAVQTAVGANLHRAITGPGPAPPQPTGLLGTIAAGLGVALHDYTAKVEEAQNAAGQGAIAANRSFYNGVDNTHQGFLDRAKEIGSGLLGAVGYGPNYFLAPITGGLNAVGDPAIDSYNHFVATTPAMRTNIQGRVFTPAEVAAPHGLAGDVFTDVTSMAGGGEAAGLARGAPVLVTMPEQMRGLAIDAMRNGEIRNPSDILAHVAPGTQITPAMRVTIPRAQDFETGARTLLPPDASPEAILRVTKTLQDTWRDTGVGPLAAAQRATTDATLREELVTQDVAGRPVQPQHLAAAPAPPISFGQRVGGAPTVATEHPGPMSAGGQATFVNSVDESMAVMQSLEGSPDIAGHPQVSRTGAVGRFQIEPSTARQYGFDPNRLSDPAYNQTVAHTIITDLYRRFNGNLEAMSIAYNDGPGRARQWLNQGPGTRLEAVRDNSVRGGWRYVAEASDRNETFMPRETQEYVARARYKMGKPEEPATRGTEDYTPPPHAEVPADVEARITPEEDRSAALDRAEEQRESISSGSVSAASVWDHAPVEDAYEEIASATGDQRDVVPVTGLSLYDRAITAIASRLQPAKAIDDLVQKTIDVDPEKEFSNLDAFRQAAHSDDRANQAMGYNYAGAERGGIVVRDGDNVVRVLPDTPTARGAFQQAIRDKGNPDDFMRWLVARRVVALESGGKETPFNLMAARRIMRDDKETEKYSQAAHIWDGFNKGVRDYAQASGRYSAAQIKGMEDADLGTWVSFRRLSGDMLAAPTGRGFTVGSPVKGMKGSTEGIVGDPLSNSLDNVRQMFKAADNNYAVGKLINLAEANPDLAVMLGIRKVRAAGGLNLNAVEKEMKAYGIPEDKWDAAHDAIASLMQNREHLGNNEFAYYNDGQKEVWQAAWPELVQMIKGSSPIQVDAVTQVFRDIAHGVQGAVTALPSFAVKMFSSHQMVQFINDPLHPPPFLTGANGLVKLMKMDGMLEHAAANGALGSSMRMLDRDTHYDTMTQVLGETGWLDRVRNDIGNYKSAPSLAAAKQLVGTTVLTPFRMMRALGERLDIGNRVGLLQAGEKAGLSPLKAGARAAEYGIDYTNRGASAVVNWWSSMVPFMRANLLYSEQAVKAIERNPGAYAAYATMAVTMPKMLLYGLNALQDAIPPGQPGYLPEHEKFRNIPPWQRLYYFITPAIAGQRMMLRMPDFAAFPFGAVPEAIMMALHEHNPAQFKDLFTTFLHDYVPPTMPPAVQAPLEAAGNINLETWQPLTPSSMTGIAGQLRYVSETSGPAQALARVLGPPVPVFGIGKIPPMAAIEHVITGWADGPGQLALDALGAPRGRPGAPSDVARLPFVNAFMLANPEGGRALDDFYSEKDQFDQWAQAKTELRHEQRRGDTSNLAAYGEQAVRFAAADRKIEQVSMGLSTMRDALYGIDANKTMSDDDKRTRTNQVLDQYMIPAAQAATAAMRQAREQGDPRVVANPQAAPADQFGF